MIFVTLGTQKFKMDRVILEIDRLIQLKKIDSKKIVIQHGYSSKSKFAESVQFMSNQVFQKNIEECDLVICHGGTSSIINALKNQKKVISIPRNYNYGEHVDNHQFEIVEVLKNENYIKVVEEMKDLENSLIEVKYHEFNNYTEEGTLFEDLKLTIFKLMGEN